MTARKVTLFLPSLAAGGAERTNLNLGSALASAGCSVTLLLQRFEGSLTSEVPPNVNVVSLNSGRSLTSLIPLTRYMKKAKPDFFVANMGHGNIISLWARALSQSHTHIIVCQHSLLSAECKAHKNWQYKILPWSYRHFLPSADAIIAVSNAVADDLSYCANIARDRITIIYNAVIGPDFDQRMHEVNAHPWLAETVPFILGAGRLVAEKDFASLIKAFAIVRKERNLRLIIAGQGELFNYLNLLADELNVTDYIAFIDHQSNPLPFIRKAAALVVSSRYEGMSNVLVEALACGTNVVSTDCGGPAEILENGRYGQLVPVGDITAMTEAITTAIEHPKDSEFLQQRGKIFSYERAAQSYIKLFENLSAKA